MWYQDAEAPGLESEEATVRESQPELGQRVGQVLPLDGVPVAADGGEAEAEVVVEEREAAYDFREDVLGEF
jgi:hypothetical protein